MINLTREQSQVRITPEREASSMALSRRQPQQQDLWVTTSELPCSPGQPFYLKLNDLLAADGFDSWLEDLYRPHYADGRVRPSIPPGVYFRMI